MKCPRVEVDVTSATPFTLPRPKSQWAGQVNAAIVIAILLLMAWTTLFQ
jgi:hypothetical protein